MTKVGVQQRIGDYLPHLAVHYGNRDQRQPLPHQKENIRGKILHHLLKQVDPGASQNDAPNPSCKGREAERDGLSSAHYFYLSGSGTTGKLRCPAASTARTPNITLSFETFTVARVPPLTVWTYSQSAALVERHTTSYAAAPAEGSHVKVVSFSRFLVCIFTLAGGAGADANEARVAAFSRATCAT